MNIGLFHGGNQDCGIIPYLYPLIKSKLIRDLDGNTLEMMVRMPAPKNVLMELDGHNFFMCCDYKYIEDCDIKIYATDIRFLNHETIPSLNSKIDYFLINNCNGEYFGRTDIIASLLENEKVIIVLGHLLPYDFPSHPRLILDPSIDLFLFYYRFGYYWLNYYKNTDKKYLIGTYNWQGNQYKTWRSRFLDNAQDILGDNLKIFLPSDISTANVANRLLVLDSWQTMHITSYTDFNSTVANIMFETQGAGEDSEQQGQMILTEKTLKSILFQKAGIFFIYWGNWNQLKWLHEKGFWFLNSEFHGEEHLNDLQKYNSINLDFNLSSARKEIKMLFVSVFKTLEYVKDLENTMNSKQEVYEYLFDKYKENLDQTSSVIDSMLSTCEWKDRLFNLLGITVQEEK
jgi:predicted house-cleaning noncanonical NTP pyrophosphatase (MazG superfamily)